MLDYRMRTFLMLCDTLSYTKTAEELQMTQPGVTQHIQHIERYYGCKLFLYNGKKLSKTEGCILLESHVRSAKYNGNALKQKLLKPSKEHLRIGATKTIGDYVLRNKLTEIIAREEYELMYVVDNTKNLLEMIDHNKLDIAIIEGFFDKESYGHMDYCDAPFVGVCNNKHSFAGKSVRWDQVLDEKLLIREEGSGTRAVLEQLLMSDNYSLDAFDRKACISSFTGIGACIEENIGITFAYEAFAKSNNSFATFTIEGKEVKRTFSYVFLKDINSKRVIDIIQGW